jgi:hypothetical protein
MLPSITGIWSKNTRSPAKKVLVCSSDTVRSLSVCAVGHDAHFVDQLVAHRPSKSIEIELPARRQRPGQVLVTDEHGAVAQEGRVAEDMIGMAVRVDDMPDGLSVRARMAASSRPPHARCLRYRSPPPRFRQ